MGVFKIGQREMTAVVFSVIMVVAAILGKTPESTSDLIFGLIVPLGVVAGNVYFLFLTIQKRVTDPDDKLEAGDIWGLLGSSEFRTAFATSIIALLPRFGLVVGDETKNLLLTITVNALGVIALFLNRSFTQRLSRQSV